MSNGFGGGFNFNYFGGNSFVTNMSSNNIFGIGGEKKNSYVLNNNDEQSRDNKINFRCLI